MENRLQEAVAALCPPTPGAGLVLPPSIHATNCFAAEQILREGYLKTQDCSVFNAPRVYSFLGLHSYIVASDIRGAVTDSFHLPCSFLLDTRRLPIHSAYPFDTGAHQNGLFSDVLPSPLQLEEFALDPSPKGILSYIHSFYGSLDNYLMGTCCLRPSVAGSIAVRNLIHLLTSNARLPYDGRCNTIEIQCNQDIPLEQALLGLVVPQSFMENEALYLFRQEYPAVQIRHYREHTPLQPQIMNGSVMQLVNTLVEEYIEKVKREGIA